MIYSTLRYRVNNVYFQVNNIFSIYTKTDLFTLNFDDLLDIEISSKQQLFSSKYYFFDLPEERLFYPKL